MNDSELKTLNFENNFENNDIDKVFDLKDAHINNLNVTNPNNNTKEILIYLFVKPILNKKTMLELSGIQFGFLFCFRILFWFFILFSAVFAMFYKSNDYISMLIIIFDIFISSFVIVYRQFYLKEIPNDKTIETIKDAKTNKNMTKVNLEDLKS